MLRWETKHPSLAGLSWAVDQNSLEGGLALAAGALADRTRARMLCALMDGRAYTATEMSVAGGVSASTASAHLRVLVDAGMLACVPQGRNRYYRIASHKVAEMLEGIMGLAADLPRMPSKTPPNLRFARTCYAHMAGALAVALHDRLVALAWLNHDSAGLSELGRAELNRIGIPVEPATAHRRFVFGCLDWSERRVHVGGQLGAVMLAAFERQRWVVRQPDSRELALTPKGSRALNEHFGLTGI